MAASLDTTIGGYSSGSGNTGHTLGSPSVADNLTRAAVAVIMSDEIGSGHAFTIGGQSMTALRATTISGAATHSFYLLNPPSGTPSVVYSCNSGFFATRTRVWFLYLANQVAPTYGEATGTSSVPTISLPTNTAADYLCMGEAENNAVGVTPSGWTERVNAYAGLACDRSGPASGSVNFTTSMSQWAVQCVVVSGLIQVTLTGAISSISGTIVKNASLVRTGAISSISGTIVKAVTKIFTGAISSITGSILAVYLVTLTGAISSITGAMVIERLRIFARIVAAIAPAIGIHVKTAPSAETETKITPAIGIHIKTAPAAETETKIAPTTGVKGQ